MAKPIYRIDYGDGDDRGTILVQGWDNFCSRIQGLDSPIKWAGLVKDGPND